MLQELFAQVSKYIDPSMMIVVVVLLVLGMALKTTPMVQDWLIIWILPAVGIVFAILLLGLTVMAVLQGILAAAMAVLFYQMWKQTKEKQ